MKNFLMFLVCMFIVSQSFAALTNYNYPLTIKCENGDGAGVSSFILIRENSTDTYITFLNASTDEIAPKIKIQNGAFDWNFSMPALYPEVGDLNARTFLSIRTSNELKVPWFATLTTLDARDMFPTQTPRIIAEHFDCRKDH